MNTIRQFHSYSNANQKWIDAGATVASASTKEKKAGLSSSANSDTAAKVGALIAQRAKDAGVETVVFDRGGFLFSNKVKALADAAREAGLQF